jgi:hypothetical protein
MTLNCDVYLLHYAPLIDRLEFMKSQLKDIDYKIISEEPPVGWIENNFEKRIFKMKNFGGNPHSSVTRAAESLAWKHYIFLLEASKSERPSLVLEDDAILSPNFFEIVNQILKTDGWDIVFPGSGCNLRAIGHGLIKKDHPASKCTDAYIVTPDTARKLSSTLSEVHLPIDWELNYQMMFHGLNVYWHEPPIVRQGSQDGSFVSAINGKRENIFAR